MDLSDLPKIVTAIGGLGTAAFGLVDASKPLLGGGVNHIGFGGIRKTVKSLTQGNSTNALSQDKILATLQANWFNGTDLGSQKSIAKSLIKLNLSAGNAEDLAKATGVDPGYLKAIAGKIAAGTPLAGVEINVNARFDLILTALLDETYQRSDNLYTNWTRVMAAAIAVLLAIAGGMTLKPPIEIWQSVIVGLIATPLAPIAKDLSSALATAVNTMQLVKK
jgi:hypothetical protein